MKQNNFWRRALCIVLTVLIMLPALPLATKAEETPVTVTVTVNLNEYIVFDLAKGNVTIGSTYSGFAYVKNAETNQWELIQVSGKARTNNDRYYVLQSTTKSSISIDHENAILTATATDIDNELMINKTDVQSVYDNWEAAATATGRAPTSHYITLSQAGRSCDLTIDDIWSNNQVPSQSYLGYNGGLHINIQGQANMKVTLRLRGDNRLHYLYYACSNVSTSGLSVYNAAESTNPVGSLTVIGSSAYASGANYSSIYQNGAAGNNWNSVFGATDSTNNSYNMVFNSGVIYAGAHETENCTAIGGGGNGVGKITVNGGTITAVTHSTGTALGGGIAHTGSGGVGYVTITGGTVYAYNFGLKAYDRVKDNQYGSGATQAIKDDSRHVPGTAIGGASSLQASGSLGEVTISGGTVYAESLGGAGIGGGNTIVGSGGSANVTITGGEVTAKSTAKNIVFDRKKNGAEVSTFVSEGAGIGGGSSKLSSGGYATVKITGGQVTSNGIGGGNSTNKSGGDATVTVEAGTVVSTGIGGGFSQVKGYAEGTVTIKGGSLNSSMAAVPKSANGEILYLTKIAFFEDTNTLVGEKILDLNFGNSLSFSTHDIYTDTIGMIYLWLPAESTVLSGRLQSKTEDVNFTPNYEADKDIDANSVSSLIYDSTIPRYTVTIAGSDLYTLFLDQERNEYLSGAAIVEQGVFTYYLQIEKGYSLIPYVGTILADGSKVMAPLDASAMTLVDETYNLYQSWVHVQSNTAVWYAVKDEATGEESFNFDLTIGNVEITEEADGSITVSQNGYVLSGQTGEIYLTSAGFPTDHTVTVRSEKETDSSISIHADELNIISVDSALILESGSVNLTFGENNNLIHSINSSPIQIGEFADLNLSTANKESISLSTSAQKTPIIVGAGTLNLNNQGGFLDIQETNPQTTGVNQIAVGQYNFEGQNDQFSTELYKGKYSYTVIGFMQENVLYSIDDTPDESKTFSARGIYEIFDAAELKSSYTVENDVLIYTLNVLGADDTVGMYKLTDDKKNNITQSLFNDGYITEAADKKSIEIKIPGSYFANGNITINAAVNNTIPYQVLGNDTVLYDGNSHGITVMVDDIFDVYYSTEEITAPDASKTSEITRTNVGSYTVYFYICESTFHPDTERDYEPKSGFATFTIEKANNEWIEPGLTCSDIICGNEPNAHAAAKWGNVTYTYYNENAGADPNVPITPADIAALSAGHTDPEKPLQFSVIAHVEGTDNYDEMTSQKIHFLAVVLSAYAQLGRQLDEIVNGATDTLGVATAGAFSVYFSATSDSVNSKLELDCALPIGTKVTLIVFSGGAAKYYYHVTDAADLSNGATKIMLTRFYAMGTDTAYSPPTDGSVEYQFCFEYQNLANGLFSVCLNGEETAKPQLNCMLSWVQQLEAIQQAQQQAEKIVVEGGDREISISVNPVMQGTGYKFLAFKITGTDGDGNKFSLVNMETALSVLLDNSVTSELQPVASSDDFLLFRIGQSTDASIDKTYTLIISNVKEGDYTLRITADIRMLEDNLDSCYALFGEDAENHATKDCTVTVMGKTHLSVKPVSQDQLITSGREAISFVLSTNDANINSNGLIVTVYQKKNGRYEQKVSLPISIEEGNRVTIPASVLAQAENGTYRIQFDYGGATCYINVIVKR